MGEILNKQRLSKILGKSERTLTEWQKEGMPIETQGERGQSNTYDTEKVIDWMLTRSNSNAKRLEEANLRIALSNAELAEIRVQEKREELIPLDKMKYMWANVLATFRARVLSMPTRLTPIIITHKDPKKIERLLKDACHEALNELSEYAPETDKERKTGRARSPKNGGTAAAS